MREFGLTGDRVTSGRIDDIEALRAVAILLTIIGHFRFVLKWQNAKLLGMENYIALWAGVDLFFVISGFVIARDLIGRYEQSENREQFWRATFAFWIRRAYRIWPTSWFWATMLVVAAVAIPGVNYFPHFRLAFADLSAVVMHVVNFHIWSCQAQLDKAACGGTVIWWSLSLEEQFYLALPLVFLFVPKKRLTAVLVGLIAIQFFIPRANLTFAWSIRTDALLFGVLLAMLERTKYHAILTPTFMNKRLVAIPALALLLYLLVEIPGNDSKIQVVPFSTGLVALVAAMIVFIASYDRDYIVRSRSLKPIFIYIGSRSYALYIVHAFNLYLTAQVWDWLSPRGTAFGPNYTLRFALTFIVLTFGLAELNYRLLETPLRNRGKLAAKSMANAPTTSEAASPALAEHAEH
ncbi:acyltransferase [Paraburkholderia sp. J94]|uniref:acyltransferase family protein n=1 Tax=Paraburkholderia sp. J94 TaxID=2805441 RepID=UPI002AB0FED8|nr:acyltransferase [Paraburkholderia sp. J94]